MQAYVYKSRRKSDTYVYLRERDGFGLIPEPLRGSLGALDFVLELALTAERKLAREDAGVVRSNLAERGFHLQFPPVNIGVAPVENPRDMAAHIALSAEAMNARPAGPDEDTSPEDFPARGALHGDA